MSNAHISALHSTIGTLSSSSLPFLIAVPNVLVSSLSTGVRFTRCYDSYRSTCLELCLASSLLWDASLSPSLNGSCLFRFGSACLFGGLASLIPRFSPSLNTVLDVPHVLKYWACHHSIAMYSPKYRRSGTTKRPARAGVEPIPLTATGKLAHTVRHPVYMGPFLCPSTRNHVVATPTITGRRIPWGTHMVRT